MNKNDLLINLRNKRKKYGKNSKEVYKAIYNLTKYFPYYPGYSESWLNRNEHNL